MMKLYLLLALLAGSLLPAAAQTLDPTFTPPASVYMPGNTLVLGPAQADGKQVVAGDFTRMKGVPANNLARLDAAGNLDLAFTQNVGVTSGTNRIRAGLNGQYLLGLGMDGTTITTGSITAGGITRNGLLRLNADGTADTGFDVGAGPMDDTYQGYLYDFAVQPDGKVLACGSFTTFNGVAAEGLVRLNLDGSVDNSFLATPTSYASKAMLVKASGKVLLGGYFGTNRSGLARLNADGSLDTSFQSPLPNDTEVDALVVQPDGRILVCGHLDGSLGYNRTLVRLLASGDLDPGFNMPSSAGTLVGAYSQNAPMAALPNGQVLVVGTFGRNRVARLNSDGSLDSSFTLSVPFISEQWGISRQSNGDFLLVSGPYGLHSYGSLEAPLARFSSAGTLITTYNPRPQITGAVLAMVRLPGGDLVVGGRFNEWNGQPVNNLGRVSSTGVFDAAFANATGELPGIVQALAVQPNGQVLAGTTRGLLRFAATGTPDNTFSFYLSTLATNALAVQADGRVLAGCLNNGGYASLVRLTNSGGQDASFNLAPANGGRLSSICSLLVQADGRIVVGGYYSVLRFEATGVQDATFTPVAVSGGITLIPLVLCLVQQPDGKLLAGGIFGSVGNNGTPAMPRPHLVRLTSTGSVDPSFVPTSAGSPVTSLALQPNGRILVGVASRFTLDSGRLVRLLDNGQTDASFSIQNPLDGAVYSLLVQPDGGIVVGGGFSTLVGQPARSLARLNAPGVLAVTAPAAVAAATALWPVPAHDVLRVLPAPAAHPQQAELLDALGRVVQQQALAGPGEFSLDTGTLPAGLYVLRLRYAEGTVSRQLAVE